MFAATIVRAQTSLVVANMPLIVSRRGVPVRLLTLQGQLARWQSTARSSM